MRAQRRAAPFLIALVLAAGWATGMIFAGQPDRKAVYEIVAKFCQAEFSGVEDIRLDLAKFSPEGAAAEEKRGPLLWAHIVSWSGDPLYVVTSFNISDVSMREGEATAYVVYRRIAKTDGVGVWSRRIVPELVEHEVVTLKLVREKGFWFILDPPPPRISKNDLVKCLKNALHVFPPDWLQRTDITEIQKDVYRNLQKALETVKMLQ